MEEPLLASAPVEGEGLIEVIAPSTLSEGYDLVVEQNGKTFMVTVPSGGVTEGQTFQAVPRPVPKATTIDVPSGDGVGDGVSDDRIEAPKGEWRSSCMESFLNYCCTAVCFVAFCFPGLVIGQVMTRLGLDIEFKFIGLPRPLGSGITPFGFIGLLVIVSLFVPGVNVICLIVFVYWGTKLRGYMRDKYEIPGDCITDCLCVYFCSFCSVIQMSSHTHDLHEHKSDFCSDTGLKPGAPYPV